MDDMMKQLEADGVEEQKNAMTLAELVGLGEMQVAAEGRVDAAEKAFKEAKAALNDIKLRKLPEAMGSASSFTLSDGRKVELKTKMTCSVPKARKDAIIKKVREDEHGAALVSTTMTVDLGKGTDLQSNEFGDVRGKLEEMGFTVVIADDINTTSLKAYLTKKNKEAGEQGEVFDLGFYGAFEVRETKIS